MYIECFLKQHKYENITYLYENKIVTMIEECNSDVKIKIYGLDFIKSNNSHKKMKKEVLSWCLKREEEELGEGHCEYNEFIDAQL